MVRMPKDNQTLCRRRTTKSIVWHWVKEEYGFTSFYLSAALPALMLVTVDVGSLAYS